MGCIYEEPMTGVCSLSVDDNELPLREGVQQGADKSGVCNVSEDPDPSINCEAYDSDWVCQECDTDLNVRDCECEDEM